MSSCPSTPPRSSKTSNSGGVFRTPKTSQYNFGGTSITPKSSTKKTRNILKTPVKSKQHVPVAPISPEITPLRSPRKKKRTIRLPSEVSNKMARLDDNPFGHILPAPSTIGTGRRVSPIKSLKAASTLDLSFFESIAHEEEELDDNNFIKSDNLSIMKSFDFSNNLDTSDDFSIFADSSPSSSSNKIALSEPIIPSTPNRQMIDEEKITNWHGKSFNNNSDDEAGPDELRIEKATVVNPFLSNTSTTPTPHNKNSFLSKPMFNRNSPINYATHNEYINTRTGQRKVVALSEEESKFKPRKLDFSNI